MIERPERPFFLASSSKAIGVKEPSEQIEWQWSLVIQVGKMRDVIVVARSCTGEGLTAVDAARRKAEITGREMAGRGCLIGCATHVT